VDGVGFDEFIEGLRPRLARAFVAAYGAERGQEALAEAMACAWEQYGRLVEMDNPAGFLFRVGQSRSRPRRGGALFPSIEDAGVPSVEPALPGALSDLSERQRVCVVLIHGYGWTHQEVADLLDLSRSSVQSHAERGLARLRSIIGTVADA
jgi:DNA-directed RNA polymerase specialized sigma24 family protein